MMRSALRVVVLTSAVLALGCAARNATGPVYDGYGHELVTVAPGVQVIANYDEPIFYADHFYWRSYQGHWYRSPIYTSGWRSAPPPRALLRIKQPQGYAHYRAPAPATHRHARSGRRLDPPLSVYQSPPRRLDPRQSSDTRPNGGLRRPESGRPDDHR